MDEIKNSIKKDIRPDIPGLKAMESGQPSTADAADNSASSSGDLNKLESKATNFIYNPIGSKGGVMSRFGALIGRNKVKSSLGGGIFASLILLIIFGSASIGGFALITIEKDLLRYEGKVEQTAESKAEKSILNHLLCRALSGNPIASSAANCNKTNDPEDEAEGDQAEAQAKDATQEAAADDAAAGDTSVTEMMDKFSFTDPQVEQDLTTQGIQVEETGGQFSGLRDSTTGETITTDDINSSVALDSTLETALPEIQVGEEQTLRPLETQHAGDSFDVLGDEPTDDPAKEVEDAIIKGAPEDQLVLDQEENNSENQSEGPGQKAPSAATVADENAAVTDSNSELNAAEKVIDSGGTEPQALDAAESTVNLQSPLLVSATASDLCEVDKVATQGAANRVPTIMTLAMRHFSTLISIADQSKTGHVTGKDISGVMGILDGDPASAANILSSKTGNESNSTSQIQAAQNASLPWDRSAGWLRATGNASKVDTDPRDANYTPDLDPSSLPKANQGTKVVNLINNALIPVGGKLTCAIENSPFGSIGNFVANTGEFLSNIGDFGISEAATAATGTAASLLLKYEIIPDVVKYFTPVGLFGNEFSTQWLDVADMGANLTFNDYSRDLGAEPVNNSAANTQYALASQAEQQTENSQSFAYRAFAISNPDSMISKFIVSLPMSKTQMLSSTASYITDIPKDFGDMFSIIFNVKPTFADTNDPSQDATPGLAYGITQYGFSNVTQYDPIANELYLTQTKLSFGSQSASIITMLGDPLQYPNATPDTSTTDVLHCFTQGFTSTATETTDNPICGSLGNYDYCDPGDPNNQCTAASGSQAPDDISAGNVATSFCDYLGASGNQGCINSLATEVQQDDIIDRFRQYIMDVHVMDGFTSLTNNQ